MTTSHGQETRRIAEDGTQEPGGLVPPYPGRTEGADVQDGPSYRDGVRVGGATGPVMDDEMKAARPEDTPGGRTASPADEQPAATSGGNAPDEGSSESGSHTAGVPRGEKIRGSEAGREHLGHDGPAQRPAGTSTARDLTGVDPQDPVTTTPERAKG